MSGVSYSSINVCGELGWILSCLELADSRLVV